jgi:hypothetical protein
MQNTNGESMVNGKSDFIIFLLLCFNISSREISEKERRNTQAMQNLLKKIGNITIMLD